MAELKINKESFEETIKALETVLETLENYNIEYLTKLSDKVSNSESEFTTEYINSLEVVKKEWNNNLVKELGDLISKCKNASTTFDNVDITISTTIKNGGSF